MMSFRPRKRFGQNFLTDNQVIQSLVQAIHPQTGDQLVEIGPGLGALTFALLPHVPHLTVVELDRDLAKALCEKKEAKLTVHACDALQFDFARIAPAQKIRVVGNLPYNVSTPLLFHLLSFAEHIQDMHFMLQKEVVDRLVAAPGSQDYGRLSVMIQYACQAKSLLTISPTAFYPVPKVQSAFVRLTPYTTLPYPAQDLSFFSQVVKQAFSQRRKTLRNSLRGLCSLEDFKAADIDPTSRAEQLSVAAFVKLSETSKKR